MLARIPGSDSDKNNNKCYVCSGLEKYSLDVSNVVDVRHERNFELMMRFQTLIKSEDTSYTDLNGFQARNIDFVQFSCYSIVVYYLSPGIFHDKF